MVNVAVPFYARELKPLERGRLMMQLNKLEMVRAINNALTHFNNKYPRLTKKSLWDANRVYTEWEESFFTQDHSSSVDFYCIMILDKSLRNMLKVFCRVTGFQGKLQNLGVVEGITGEPQLIIKLGVD